MWESSQSASAAEHWGTRDFIPVAEKMVGSALRGVGGHHARLYQLETDTGALRCVASAGETDRGAMAKASVDADLACARLAARGEGARGTPDVLAEPECHLDALTREMVRTDGRGALAAAPVRARGTVVGSLVVGDRTGRRYTDRDLLFLAALTDQVALAFETSRVRTELVQQRFETSELALVASLTGEGLDLVTVGQRIAESVLGLLGVHSSAIRLFRPDGALAAIALAGRAKEYAGAGDVVPAGVGLVGRAGAEGRPMWTSDIRIDARFEPDPGIRARNVTVGTVAGLAVPLRAAGAVIGVLSVGSPEPRTFTQAEVDLLQRFADQAAIAIRNARTQETLLKQAERLRILHDIDLAIIAETAPVAIAEAVLWRLRDLLGVPRAIVNLFDWATGEVEWLAAVGRHRIYRGPGVRYSLRLAGDLDSLRRGEPQVMDVRELLPSPEADALLASGVRVFMVVPMIAGGELIGSVSFGGDQVQFPEEQVGIAREVATQLAIALRQARLVERLKASYEEVQRAQAQLAQAQKMEAIGQLAGGIAHDFNNLLTVIGGRSSLLLMKMGRDDPARKDVDLIESTAQRAAGLTRQLLAFSRKQVLEPKPVDLDVLVAGVAPMLKRLIGEHIEIVIVPGRRLGHVMADVGQMEQVIVNLVVNARDAMPEGGTITLEASSRTAPDSGLPAPDHHVPPGEYVTLSIRDTGCGMDPATQARIFEPFFTTKEPGKGTGLGLSTVYGIVHQSSGYLAVDSAVGRGTTFTIYLPCIPDQGGASPAAAGTRADLVGGSGTVLLVEDDADLRQLTSEILKAAGYAVVEAGDPLEALTVCDRRHEAIDLLLTDIVMPALRGPELAARLRSSYPALKVLFMSGYTADTGGAPAGEPAAFLQKPFTPHDLTRAVREVLDSGPGP
jgi:signal transduction histidine kinase